MHKYNKSLLPAIFNKYIYTHYRCSSLQY